MQATAFFAVAVVVGLLMLVVFGVVWFLAVPIAFLLFLVPVAFVTSFAIRRTDHGHPPGGEGVPSSAEASYDPVVDPSERPTTG
jgi:fatty acid desaturase